VIFSEFFELFM